MIDRFKYQRKCIKVAIVVNSMFFSNLFYCSEIEAGNNKRKNSTSSDVDNYDYEEVNSTKKNKKKIRDTLKLDKKEKKILIPKSNDGNRDSQKPLILYNNYGTQPNGTYVQPIYQPVPVIMPPQLPSNYQPAPPVIVNTPSNYQPVPPIIVNTPSQNDNGSSNEKVAVVDSNVGKQSKPKKKKKKKKNDENKNNIFVVNDSPFMDPTFSSAGNYFELPRSKSYYALTFSGLFSVNTAALFFSMKDSYDKYKQGEPLNENTHTFFGFLRWLITDLNRDTMPKLVVPATLLGRIITSFNFEWRHVCNRFFSVSFIMNHIIFPGMLLEVHTNFYAKNSFGIGFKIGLDEILKVYMAMRFGGFYIKINGPGLGMLDLAYIFYNNGLDRNSSNKARSRFWDDMFKKADEKALTPYVVWDVFNPFADKLKMKDKSLFYILIQKLSIEFGGISENKSY